MTETEMNYPKIDKQKDIVGVPFQVVSDGKEIWKSNYAYWQKTKREGTAFKPLFGRYVEKQFQVYSSDTQEWENKNLWDDFSELNEDTGKKNLLFSKLFETVIKFQEPTDVSFWDKETKGTLTEQHETIVVQFSKGLYEKINKERSHPRANPTDFYELSFDNKKAPADMYSVEVKIE